MQTTHNDTIVLEFDELQTQLDRLTASFLAGHAEEIAGLAASAGAAGPLFTRKKRRPDQPVVGILEGNALYAESPLDVAEDVIRKALFPGRFNLSYQDRKKPSLEIGFQRTLRIPDDGKEYPLPAGLGEFELAVGRQANSGDGEMVLPMYQSEAMWIYFRSTIPVALRVITGSINAVSGGPAHDGLRRDPQNYLTLPEQPWLDGFAGKPGCVRQFVAAPIGLGATAEEQIAGTTNGAITFEAHPIRAEVLFNERVVSVWEQLRRSIQSAFAEQERHYSVERFCPAEIVCDMGLAPGGLISQQIFEDRRPLGAWTQDPADRATVRIINAVHWFELTGQVPPTLPITAGHYLECGLPWFDFYRSDLAMVEASETMRELRGMQEILKPQMECGEINEMPPELLDEDYAEETNRNPNGYQTLEEVQQAFQAVQKKIQSQQL